jgi:RNA polymerase sigma-70 factor (ECF subfamily)
MGNWHVEDIKVQLSFMKAFAGEMHRAGELVGGEGLDSHEDERIVRAGAYGATEVTDGHFAERFVSGTLAADQLLEREETRRIVRDAIAQLPDPYRTVLVLRDIEEMSTQEVAEALEITTSAVKVRLHRARQALFTLLRRHYEVPAATR